MGLEQTFRDIPLSENLLVIQSRLEAKGWAEVNFGFHLGRSSGALDLQKERQRVLIYLAPPSDRQAYSALTAHNLPQLPVSYQAIDNQSEQGLPQNMIATASVPLGARALDSMRFQEQQPVTGYLGAQEIMASIARLLARIFKQTASIPPQIMLGNLMFSPGEDDIIKLIPPLELQPTDDWRYLVKQLLQDLNAQDPLNDHTGQIDVFNKHFSLILEQHD